MSREVEIQERNRRVDLIGDMGDLSEEISELNNKAKTLSTRAGMNLGAMAIKELAGGFVVTHFPTAETLSHALLSDKPDELLRIMGIFALSAASIFWGAVDLTEAVHKLSLAHSMRTDTSKYRDLLIKLKFKKHGLEEYLHQS